MKGFQWQHENNGNWRLKYDPDKIFKISVFNTAPPRNWQLALEWVTNCKIEGRFLRAVRRGQYSRRNGVTFGRMKSVRCPAGDGRCCCLELFTLNGDGSCPNLITDSKTASVFAFSQDVNQFGFSSKMCWYFLVSLRIYILQLSHLYFGLSLWSLFWSNWKRMIGLHKKGMLRGGL